MTTNRTVSFLHDPLFIHAHSMVSQGDNVHVTCPRDKTSFRLERQVDGTLIVAASRTRPLFAFYALAIGETGELAAVTSEGPIEYISSTFPSTLGLHHLARVPGINRNWVALGPGHALCSTGRTLESFTFPSLLPTSSLKTFHPIEWGFVSQTDPTKWITISKEAEYQYGTWENGTLTLGYHGPLPQSRDVTGGFYRDNILTIVARNTVRTYDFTDLDAPVLITERFDVSLNDIVYAPDEPTEHYISSEGIDPQGVDPRATPTRSAAVMDPIVLTDHNESYIVTAQAPTPYIVRVLSGHEGGGGGVP